MISGQIISCLKACKMIAKDFLYSMVRFKILDDLLGFLPESEIDFGLITRYEPHFNSSILDGFSRIERV